VDCGNNREYYLEEGAFEFNAKGNPHTSKGALSTTNLTSFLPTKTVSHLLATMVIPTVRQTILPVSLALLVVLLAIVPVPM